MSKQALINSLQNHASSEIAAHSQRFFKTGPGEYGEGDVFIGIRIPTLRAIAKGNVDLSVFDVQDILQSPLHEQRLCALLIWTYQYPKANSATKEAIYQCYLRNTQYINNWDLVDASAHKLIGPHLAKRDRGILHKLAHSTDLWERRIAMFSCYYFIKRSDFSDALLIAEQLLNDKHDLIHKVVGWMLREVGKQDLAVERQFLNQHYHTMPRTMLRYAIEKFPTKLRLDYLEGKI